MLKKYYRSTIEHVRFILCLKDLFIFHVYQCSFVREREREKKLAILDQTEKKYTTNYSSLIIVSYLFILIKIPCLSVSIDTTTQLSMLQQTN